MKKFYIDTSVFGGYWDDIFKEETRAFFKYAGEIHAELIYSDVTERELKPAPSRIKELPNIIINSYEDVSLEVVKMCSEAELLAV